MEKTCERCRYMRLDLNEEPCAGCFRTWPRRVRFKLSLRGMILKFLGL